MADTKDEEKQHKGMLDALSEGIKKANGVLTDKELVLIKRSKKALKKVVDAAPGADTIKNAAAERDRKIAEMEQ